jgi:hypothetical protein
MFANFYKSKFQDFEIIPKKSLSFTPKKVAVPHQFVGLTKAVALSKITIFSFVIIGITGLGIYLINPGSNTNKSNEKQNNITIENKQENITNPTIATKIDTLKKAGRPQKTVVEKVVSNKLISTKKDDNTIQKLEAQKNKKTIALTIEDSTQAEKPKVVVVKKQIIKRDTIYVAK